MFIRTGERDGHTETLVVDNQKTYTTGTTNWQKMNMIVQTSGIWDGSEAYSLVVSNSTTNDATRTASSTKAALYLASTGSFTNSTTNNYGIYIYDVSGADSNYPIYSLDADTSYLAGGINVANTFLVAADGDLDETKNVPYSWPAANASGVLTNDGSGNLSGQRWQPRSHRSGQLQRSAGGHGPHAQR